MMEQLLNHGDQLPPLFAKYQWMVSHDDHTRGQIFYAMHDDPQFGYRCRIPEMLGKRIRGFFHGWVVLSENVMWSLWNPSTSKLIRLPPLKKIFKDEDDIITQCCLSSPPDLPGSLLLLTTNKKPTFVFCRLDRKIKKLRWTEMSYAKQLKKISIDGCLLHSLTCCNGKVYALNTDGSLASFVLNVDIVVNDKEVVIKLLLFGPCPIPDYHNFHGVLFKSYFLKGSSTELFCIIVDFNEEAKKTISVATLFQLDTTSINWVELEGLENWDMTNKRVEELQYGDFADLQKTDILWEEMLDLKDAIFFVDLGRDCSISYNHAISSESGGYIHIRGEMDNVMYSYHVNYKTIVPCSMPTHVMPTSHMLMWEYRLEDDHGEAICTVDSKHEEDGMMAVRSITREKVGFNESLLLNIPFDVLEMIMKCCVGLEYLNFRATCKRCHIAAPSIQWSNKTSSRRLQTYSLVSPWLMVVEKNQGILTFKDPMLGDNYFMKNSQVSIVEGSNHLYCSKFGWLLFENRELDCLVLFNPFTKDLRKLPEVDYYMRTCLCFSAPPTSSNCMVAGFTNYGQWRIHILKVAQEPTRWHMFSLAGVGINSIHFPTFYREDLYALSNEGEIIHFKDLGGEDYSGEYTKTKAPRSCYKSEALFYLMTCDRHLLLVIVDKSIESVEVFKHNDSTKEWEKIDCLGRHMIYICDTTCLCVEAKTPEMENKVYFPCLHPTNGKIVFYSLETCMFHTFNGKNIQEHFGGLFKTVRHHDLLAWIEPRWS